MGLVSRLRMPQISQVYLLWLAGGVWLTAASVLALPLHMSSLQTGEWHIRTWETEEGLPENSATAMVQTKDGYLWFGTFSGLVRFDGVEFHVFDLSNTPQLPSAQIVNVYLDRQDRLWVSTDNGIVTLHRGKWSSVYGPAEGWTGDYVRTFAEGSSRFFVTSFNGKIFEFDGHRFMQLPEPPGAAGEGYFGHIDQEGRFWAIQHGFIGVWENQHWSQKLPAAEFLGDDGGAGPARDGGLWLFNRRVLAKLADGQIVSRIELSSLAAGGFWSLIEDAEGNIWIATYNAGLLRAAPTGELEDFGKSGALSYRSIRFVFQDRESNYWVGTSGGGLMRLNRRLFYTFSEGFGLPERNIRSVTSTRSGEILAGTYGGGLVRLTQAGVTPLSFPGILNRAAYVQSVLEDSRGAIWAGTFKQGLVLIEGKDAHRVPSEQSGGTSINALFEDSRKRVWIAGNEGVSMFDGHSFQLYRTAAKHLLNSVRGITEDPRTGVIWFGDTSGRLHRYDQGTFEEVLPSIDSHGVPIWSLLAATNGAIWIGTDGAGLAHWQGGRLTRISEAQGLSAKRIGSILLDQAGYLWLSTGKGIVRVSETEAWSVVNGARSRVSCQVFDQEDYGLLTSECANVGQPGSVRDTDNHLWFATTKGLSAVDLRHLRADPVAPAVQIQRLSFTEENGLVHEAEPVSRHWVLPAGCRKVEVQFTALNFTAPSRVRFGTRLSRNGHEVSQEESDRRTAIFEWLRPGEYQLRITAANHQGVWNEEGATIHFAISPFYWQTPQFWGLLGVAIIALTMAIASSIMGKKHRQLQAQLEERKRAEQVLAEEHALRLQAERAAREASQRLLLAHELERSRVARELHDDVTQRLARLAIDAAQAKRSIPSQSGNGILHSIHDELERLSEDVHSLAYRLHPSVLDELGLVEGLRTECDLFDQRESIRTKLTADVSSEIPSEIGLCLMRIAQEALRNVARHARARTVEVSLRETDGGIQLAICDDGVGFDLNQSRTHPSLGHASMKERISLIEGELDIDSAPGHGTTIVAWAPLTTNRTHDAPSRALG